MLVQHISQHLRHVLQDSPELKCEFHLNYTAIWRKAMGYEWF